MPLARGVDDFDRGAAAPNISSTDFAMIVANKTAILDVYKRNQHFLTRPYTVKAAPGGRYSCEPANVNPLFAEIVKANIPHLAFQTNLYFPEWSDVIFEVEKGKGSLFSIVDDRKDRSFWTYRNPPAYGFIDLTLYFVHLLNVYVPNAAVLKNVYAVNVHDDALGRQNDRQALVATEKVVRKFFPAVLEGWDIRLRDIVRLIKADLLAPSPKLNRGIAFEQECMTRLEGAGFEVRATPTSGDFGADVIAHKDDLGYAIQCKDTSKPVGVKGVQEAIGAKNHYKMDYAVVCAVAGFTDAAIELAASNKVIICNADQLARRLDAV